MPKQKREKSQCAWIVEQLKTGRELTAMEAKEEFGVIRLAARINEIREDLELAPHVEFFRRDVPAGDGQLEGYQGYRWVERPEVVLTTANGPMGVS